MSDLTAIDILVNPDEAALEHARKFNARMRQSVPDGFALDATHQPHITTLQRYVHTAELEKVYDAVERTIADTDVAALSLTIITSALLPRVSSAPCRPGPRVHRALRGGRRSKLGLLESRCLRVLNPM